jgi:hypothetical protein
VRTPALAFTLVALGLALPAAPARAQELTVEVEPGWEGFFVEDGWTPLRVTLRAPPGAPPLRGRVVTESLPLERVSCSDAPFTLSPTPAEGSAARLVLAVPAHGDLSFSIRVEDEQGREIATGAPAALPRRIEGKDRLVLLAHHDGGLVALEGQMPPAISNPPVAPAPPGARLTRVQMQLLRAAQSAHSSPSAVRLARVAPEELGVSPFLLQSVSGIVLMDGPGAVELAQDPERVATLEAFVSDGGSLVIAGGSGTAFWHGSPLERLLPVTCRGERDQASSRDLAFLGDARSLGPIAIMRATLAPPVAGTPPAQWLPDAERVVAARAIGRGRVVFLAFDPDQAELRDTPNLGPFLASLVPVAHTRTPLVLADRLAEESGRIFFERPSLTTSGLLALAAGTAATIFILGPVAARRRHAPIRTLVAPALSIALAAIVIAVASLTRGPAEARVISWTFTESGAPDAIVVSDLGVYSGNPLEAEVVLDPRASLTPLEAAKVDLLTFRGRRSALRIAPGAPPCVTPVDLPARAFTWFRASARTERAEAVRVTARIEDQAIVLGPSTPRGLVLVDNPETHTTTVIDTGSDPRPRDPGEPVRLALASGRPLAELVKEDDEAPQLWDRPPEARARAHLLRTLALVADEIHLASPPSRSNRIPRVWFAFAEEPPPLLRLEANGHPIERTAWLGCTLVAAEEP